MNQPTYSPIYSLVIPIYNEEENIQEMYRRLTHLMTKLDGDVELILVDDGSQNMVFLKDSIMM